MYIFNQAPGRAAQVKGFARFPEDFARLQPGQSAVAWKDGGDWQIETTGRDMAAIKAALRAAGWDERGV